jgi:purine-binding chemotaxis protein CheW
MIKQHSYLIFRINNSLYGISTHSVQEIFLLPELTPIPEAPKGVVGVIDLRGEILPVMDLNLRFGQQTFKYSLTDQVIVLGNANLNLGIIVQEVSEVRNIPETEITDEIKHNQQSTAVESHKFIAGVVKSQKDILVIINLENLLRYISEPNYRVNTGYLNQQLPPGFLTGSTTETDLGENQTNNNPWALSSQLASEAKLTDEALTILRQRANRLKQSNVARQEFYNVRNLAILALHNELFSVDLENVREFTSIEQVVPVPCCPSHIIGNMNLRGEILTLVDICQLLNLPPINLTKVSQLMVVEVADLRVGLTIEKICDTIAVDAEEIDLAPAANYSTSKEYFKGTLSYQENMVSILDIAKILQNGNLIVDSVL